VIMAMTVIGVGAVIDAFRDAVSRWGDISLMIWPLLAIATITWCTSISRETASLVLGGYVLAFLFVGVTQPLSRTWWLIPVAAASMAYALDLPPTHTAIRVTLSILVWILVAAWPSHLLAELREQRHLLEKGAITDTLTGLNNRSRLSTDLGTVGQTASLLLIDLDHFKKYNDTNGHLAGDDVLRRFGELLQTRCRTADIAFRYGGEEFLVILPDTTLEVARDVADRLAREWSVRQPLSTFSAGIALAGPDGLAHADRMLYLAKHSGRATALIDDGAPLGDSVDQPTTTAVAPIAGGPLPTPA
jgi:diguanylate cyclase (GGDEF)-like protein